MESDTYNKLWILLILPAQILKHSKIEDASVICWCCHGLLGLLVLQFSATHQGARTMTWNQEGD